MNKTKSHLFHPYPVKRQNQRNYQDKHKLLLFIVSAVLCFPLDSLATSCSVTTTSVSFGVYNVYTTTNPGSTGQITVTCNPLTTSYTVALNSGLYGTISQRKLKKSGGTDNMLYNLFTDAARTMVWGDGTSSNGITVASSNSTPLIVYGGITPLQDISVGTYTDSVGVTVTF